jgi:hypothetical protein
MSELPNVLILTPLKDAGAFLDGYFARLKALSYPVERLSLGFLESDSSDRTFAEVERRLPELRQRFRPVLFIPSALGPNIVAPVKSLDEPPVVALKQAPILAVTPRGEEVEIAQVVTPPPVQTASARLPQTASIFPLIALLGLLSLGAGWVLSVLPRRTARVRA